MIRKIYKMIVKYRFSASQAEGRGFDPRFSLLIFKDLQIQFCESFLFAPEFAPDDISILVLQVTFV